MPALPWPLPAVLAWAVAWGVHTLALQLAWPQPVPLALACGVGLGLSLLGRSWIRRLLIAAGFPVAMLLTGLVVVPGWVWLLMLGLLLLVYPLNAWRDAPLFPTPQDALLHLPDAAPLDAGAPILDAGCGLGQGLWALRQAYPLARLHGIERSALLGTLCAWRCRWARVRRGDMWAEDWSAYAMVYMFQRPETMARAWRKACEQMAPGSWFVSLEFEVPQQAAHAVQPLPDGRPVWLYRTPDRRARTHGAASSGVGGNSA